MKPLLHMLFLLALPVATACQWHSPTSGNVVPAASSEEAPKNDSPAPQMAGNGDFYNGPDWGGASIPDAAEVTLSNEDMREAARLCVGAGVLDFLHQHFPEPAEIIPSTLDTRAEITRSGKQSEVHVSLDWKGRINKGGNFSEFHLSSRYRLGVGNTDWSEPEPVEAESFTLSIDEKSPRGNRHSKWASEYGIPTLEFVPVDANHIGSFNVTLPWDVTPNDDYIPMAIFGTNELSDEGLPEVEMWRCLNFELQPVPKATRRTFEEILLSPPKENPVVKEPTLSPFFDDYKEVHEMSREEVIPVYRHAGEWTSLRETAFQVMKSYWSYEWTPELSAQVFAPFEASPPASQRRVQWLALQNWLTMESYLSTWTILLGPEKSGWLNLKAPFRELFDLWNTDGRGWNVLLTRLILDKALPDGGAVRGPNTVFLNLARIAPSKWIELFVHEHSHQAQPDRADAVARFKQRPIVDISLEEWLTAGINLKFRAECLARARDLRVYDQGLRGWGGIDASGKPKHPNPEMEELLASRLFGETYEQTAFRFLDPRFFDPANGYLADPQNRAKLLELRERLRRKGNCEWG